MTAGISSIAPITLPSAGAVSDVGQKGQGFQSMLESYLGRVQSAQDSAQTLANNFLNGGDEELHSVALSTQRAELEFEMFLQVRNKVVSAYQEIMKMQI